MATCLLPSFANRFRKLIIASGGNGVTSSGFSLLARGEFALEEISQHHGETISLATTLQLQRFRQFANRSAAVGGLRKRSQYIHGLEGFEFCFGPRA